MFPFSVKSRAPMIDATPLTSRYKLLREIDLYQLGSEEQPSFQQVEMDRIHEKIVSQPIFSIPDALDKLAFADYCLTEENDFKEASNLVRQVFAALLITLRNSRANEQAYTFPEERKTALSESA